MFCELKKQMDLGDSLYFKKLAIEPGFMADSGQRFRTRKAGESDGKELLMLPLTSLVYLWAE